MSWVGAAWLLLGGSTVLLFVGMPWPGRPGGRPLFRV